MRAAAVLLGAGRGARLGDARPKAFVELGGTSLLRRAAETVDRCPAIELFVAAVPPGSEEQARAELTSSKLLWIVPGGRTRQASVARALEALPEAVDTVVCHDVARPLATEQLFTAVIDALRGVDGAVPCVSVVDTIKRVREGVVAETLPRDDLMAAQTPQAFRRSALEAAHRHAEDEGIEATDDAALLEAIGASVVVVEGDPSNVKITRSEDLQLAELLLRRG